MVNLMSLILYLMMILSYFLRLKVKFFRDSLNFNCYLKFIHLYLQKIDQILTQKSRFQKRISLLLIALLISLLPFPPFPPLPPFPLSLPFLPLLPILNFIFPTIPLLPLSYSFLMTSFPFFQHQNHQLNINLINLIQNPTSIKTQRNLNQFHI